MLGHQQIEERLNKGEIFVPDTWSPQNLRATGYDLRMAYDYMIVPDPPDYPTGRRYEHGARRSKPVILNPGDVAFMSTLEQLCMPWDICANIGPKFGLSAQGILLLTGLIVDPGFGMELEDGEWVPKEGERLHFLLANLGPDPAVFIPGREKIASLQFIEIGDPRAQAYPKSIGAQAIQERFFDDRSHPDAGLEFFRNMTNVRKDVKDLSASITNHVSGQIEQIDKFKDTIELFEKRITAVETGSNQVVMFGIYLMSTTILSVAFATILSAIGSPKTENTLLLALGLVVLGLPVIYFMRLMSKFRK